MYYKRNESFRFTFNEPVAGKLTKHEGNDMTTIDVDLLDVSTQGAKLKCSNTIELNKNTPIFLVFQLNTVSFQAAGNVVWIKKYPQSFEFGVHLDTDDMFQQSITNQLKQIARQRNK